jgi:mannose-6-phosphate isomerase-like protein (cupin superfamily)
MIKKRDRANTRTATPFKGFRTPDIAVLDRFLKAVEEVVPVIVERRAKIPGAGQVRSSGLGKAGRQKSAMSRSRKPIHVESKGWGKEVWIANSPLYCGKILEIRKGKRCSLHYHRQKSESIYLRCGRLRVRIKESPDAAEIEEFELSEGDCIDISPGLVHQMEAIEDAELFEFSTQHFDSDSLRLERGD